MHRDRNLGFWLIDSGCTERTAFLPGLSFVPNLVGKFNNNPFICFVLIRIRYCCFNYFGCIGCTSYYFLFVHSGVSCLDNLGGTFTIIPFMMVNIKDIISPLQRISLSFAPFVCPCRSSILDISEKVFLWCKWRELSDCV